MTGATISGHPKQEDDMALLARFVRHTSVVYSHLSVTDSWQVHLRRALQSCGKTRRIGSLCLSFPKFSKRHVRTELTLSRFRLEKAIANCKPAVTKTDPTTNFWTVYKKVTDEHDHDMISKYVGDLDTSLLFVSASASPVCHIRLNQVTILC